MAKITAPFLGLAASGTIGSTLTASKWKGRPYMRTRVIPSNPKTAAQSLTRNTFAWANSVWKLMPTLIQTPWDRFAEGQVLTGRNAFQGNVVATLRGDTDLLNFTFSNGAKGGIPPASQIVTLGATSVTLDVTTPTPPTGWTIQAVVGASIRDQDPATGILFATIAIEDLVAPYSLIISPLIAATDYQVGSWIRWVKPDLSIAYSAALMDPATTLP